MRPVIASGALYSVLFRYIEQRTPDLDVKRLKLYRIHVQYLRSRLSNETEHGQTKSIDQTEIN